MIRVYIETYGCAFNFSDSEAMAGLLVQSGCALAEAESQADVVVLNSCTVKSRTYLDFRRRLEALRCRKGVGDGPAVVVAGCVPKSNPGELLLDGVAQIGINNLADIVDAVEAAVAQRAFRKVEMRREDRLALRGIRRNPAVEILPINQGCLNACAFCQTRLARGRLHSFPMDEIVERARRAIAEGVREIWLTSQDTGAYGADIGVRLPALLERLAALEGEFKIRLGMSSPQWIVRDLGAMLEIFQSPRLYRFLHVPVQSGDERVLRAMRRSHTAAQFEALCEAFRARYPRMAIWTDIIAGFPTETEEEFARSLDLLRRTRPAAVNRSRFSPRPGTAAASMPRVAAAVVAERSRRLNRLVERFSDAGLAEWVDWEGETWVSEIKKAGSVIARNDDYRPIVLKGAFEPGQRVRVRVSSHTTYHLNGVGLE